MTAARDLFRLGLEPVKSRKAATLGEAGYERKERDFYPTEPWVTRALIQAVDFGAPKDRGQTVIWEPACGDGRMAMELIRAGYQLISSDITDYGYGEPGIDFFESDKFLREIMEEIRTVSNLNLILDAIVTNPPFDLAREFIVHALELTKPTRGKVAILQRHEFDAPKVNHPLFQLTGGVKLVLHKRPRWSEEDKASPRFPYAWYVFDWARDGAWRTLFCRDPDTIADSESLL